MFSLKMFSSDPSRHRRRRRRHRRCRRRHRRCRRRRRRWCRQRVFVILFTLKESNYTNKFYRYHLQITVEPFLTPNAPFLCQKYPDFVASFE